MEPDDESVPPPPPPEQRPVFRASPKPRAPDHELRDRARAAKLRHRAAKARVKANRLEDRARHLHAKAVEWARRADELDGVSRPMESTPVNE